MEPTAAVSILIVANKTAATPELLAAVRKRAALGPAEFHLVVPHSAHRDWHMLHVGRREKVDEAEAILDEALPLLEDAAGGPVSGSVSIREDPMDAVEETLWSGYYEEIILSTHVNHLSERLHTDLPHRVEHLGLPLTTVVVGHEVPTGIG
jgi:hypothetical protein